MWCINYSEEVDVLLYYIWWALHFAINLVLSNTHWTQRQTGNKMNATRKINGKERNCSRSRVDLRLRRKQNTVIMIMFVMLLLLLLFFSFCRWCTHHFEENELDRERKTKWTDVLYIQAISNDRSNKTKEMTSKTNKIYKTKRTQTQSHSRKINKIKY